MESFGSAAGSGWLRGVGFAVGLAEVGFAAGAGAGAEGTDFTGAVEIGFGVFDRSGRDRTGGVAAEP